jgi:hypothetical protein
LTAWQPGCWRPNPTITRDRVVDLIARQRGLARLKEQIGRVQ